MPRIVTSSYSKVIIVVEGEFANTTWLFGKNLPTLTPGNCLSQPITLELAVLRLSCRFLRAVSNRKSLNDMQACHLKVLLYRQWINLWRSPSRGHLSLKMLFNAFKLFISGMLDQTCNSKVTILYLWSCFAINCRATLCKIQCNNKIIIWLQSGWIDHYQLVKQSTKNHYVPSDRHSYASRLAWRNRLCAK